MIVQELGQKYKLSILLKIANLSKSTYFYNVEHMNDKDMKDEELRKLILKIFNENYQKYGIPRITQELKNRGNNVNKKRVERIMNDLGIHARPRTKRYNSYKGNVGKRCKNKLLVKKDIDGKEKLVRDFSTTKPYEKLGTDITVFITPYGKLYLSPVIDFHTREILGYNLSESPNYAQVRKMLKMMFDKYGDKLNKAILHSDQGYQYQMANYQTELITHDIIQSMSRKGNCLDNSPTENFFSRLKEEMYYGKEDNYHSLKELEIEIHKYIEYHNEKRIVNRLKMSPKQYKNKYFNEEL